MAVISGESVPETHRRYAPAPTDLAQPVRQSLPVEVLMEQLSTDRIEPGRLAAAMGHLEAQLRLREVDARRFTEWERTAKSVGDADALAEVDRVRPSFIDVLEAHITSPRETPFELHFSGNLPAVSAAASTVRARAAAELDTQAVETIDPNPPNDIDTETAVDDRRVGDIGWKAHDAVFGTAVAPPTSSLRTPITTASGVVMRAVARMFGTRKRRQTAR